MTTEKQFLAAIAANPDDPAYRMIYSDWLEDHGDPWADVWRSGEFCAVMGWKPFRHPVGSVCTWFATVVSGNYDLDPDDLPDDVHFRLVGYSKSWHHWRYYHCDTSAITAANRAFLLAWCDGWRPTQDDCRGGVRLVGTEPGVMKP